MSAHDLSAGATTRKWPSLRGLATSAIAPLSGEKPTSTVPVPKAKFVTWPLFVERLWRSIKYEEVYLRAYDTVSAARESIGRYLDFYNRRRPHSSLDGSTPDHAYFTPLPLRMAA